MNPDIYLDRESRYIFRSWIQIYSALRKYSAPLNFATFCHISGFKHKDIKLYFFVKNQQQVLYSIPSTVSCLCCSVPSLIHISLCTYSLSPYIVYKTVVLELLGRLLFGYYCIVGTRSTSISLHSHQHLLTMCMWQIKFDLIWNYVITSSSSWFWVFIIDYLD